MASLLPETDPNGLLEYSVVFSDRSLNHMSQSFRDVMINISNTLKKVYRAESVIVVPGGGTFGMEAVARQFASNKKCLVLRNGWFSYRWSQIIEMGEITSTISVMKAKTMNSSKEDYGHQSPMEPASIDEVLKQIEMQKPDVVFAPHVETSAGMMLPDEYISAVARAVHKAGGLFVLDCIASGALWVDMEKLGIDVLISAPQKGWSASPCSALVMLSSAARNLIDKTKSSSFSCDLNKWLQIMEAYENGSHAYHSTMPTDALLKFDSAMKETEAYGFEKVRLEQQELGDQVRKMLESKGFKSVAAEGFKAPTVIVCYTDDKDIQNGSRFMKEGIQVAAGIPLMCDEGENFQTFRIGLFGLDKLHNIERTLNHLKLAVERIL
jgi:aspartate aminotransferase-like enzyme|tara:strand:+ start:6982 stop:8124 length:1143 start_codon:yes stop_codon:yes gene_type:complete